MVSFIDVTIIILAGLSLALIAKNMFSTRDALYPLISLRNSTWLELEVDGRRYRGVALVAERVPEGDQVLAEKLGEIARSLGAGLTIVSTVFTSSKSKLLSYIDDELRRAEFAYDSTKHVRYFERIKFLRELYRRVSADHRPLIGSLAVVLWIPEDGRPAREVASSFKALLEAETGISFKEVNTNRLPELLRPLPLEESLKLRPLMLSQRMLDEHEGIVIGRSVEEHSTIALSWPRDFEAHIGVFGSTGKGKTVLLAGIAAQLGARSESRLDPYMVLVLDPKGDLARLLSRVATRVVDIDRDACIPMPRTDGLALKLLDSSRETSWSEKTEVRVCRGSLLERGLIVYDFSRLESSDRNVAVALALSSLLVEAEEEGLPGRVVVVVDEAWRISANLAFHLTLATREGRSKKLHLIYATQSPIDVPPIVLDNTKTMMVFGGFTRNYVELAHKLGLASPEILLKLPVGYTVLKIGDRPPLLVLVYNFEEQLLEKSNEASFPRVWRTLDASGAKST